MDYSDIYNGSYLVSRLIGFAIWIVVGIIIGNKAKEVGLSFGLYFVLTWLLGVIGLAISLVQINKQKKVNAMRNMHSMYQNQYQNPYAQQPYQNQYQQNMYNQGAQQPNTNYSRYNQSDYASGSGVKLHNCPNCGNSQRSGGFCEICGTKID